MTEAAPETTLFSLTVHAEGQVTDTEGNVLNRPEEPSE